MSNNNNKLLGAALRKPREAVLVVCHKDGFIQVYAERHVDVRIEQALHMPGGEIEAEEYLDSTLPHRYRELYWPGMQRAADMVRKVLPSDIAQRDWELELLKSIDRAGEILRGDNMEDEQQLWIL